MTRAAWLGAWFALALVGCNDEAGGPPPCSDDTECVPICDGGCVPDAALAAICDDFLETCRCICEDEADARMMGTSSSIQRALPIDPPQMGSVAPCVGNWLGRGQEGVYSATRWVAYIDCCEC